MSIRTKVGFFSPCAMRTNSIDIFGCCDYTMTSNTFRKYLAKALQSVQNTLTPLKGIVLALHCIIASWPVLAIKYVNRNMLKSFRRQLRTSIRKCVKNSCPLVLSCIDLFFFTLLFCSLQSYKKFNVHVIFLGMWSDQYSPFAFSQVSKCYPLVDSLTRKYIYLFIPEWNRNWYS